MKKIPTIFERDWNGARSRVVDLPHPDCAWVFAGEGVATRKLDGTCCMIRNRVLFKRRELKPGQSAPVGFEAVGTDAETGKVVGWMPVGDGPEDAAHREGFTWACRHAVTCNGTYELLGPKVQGNPERYSFHALALHSFAARFDPPRTFEELRQWLDGRDMEGLVFHHPDGRMGKIKLRDFGLMRLVVPPPALEAKP